MGPITKTSARDFIRQWRPTTPARAKPFAAEMYCSHEVYQLEQERVFGGRTWVGVGGLHQLSGPGSYFTTVVAGQPILVLRNRQGELRAFFNVCSHRAGPLARGEGTLAGVLQCQYHGWTYTLDGRLRKARDFGEEEGFDPAEFGLRPVRVDSWAHSVFVSLHPETPPLQEYLGDLTGILRPFKVEEYVYAFTQEYQERANWKLVWENASEGYHLPFVHPQLGFNPKLFREEIGGNFSLQVSVRKQQAAGKSADGSERESFVINLFPNTFMVVPTRKRWEEHFVAVYTIPEGADRTTFQLDFYVPPDRLGDEPALSRLKAAWEEVNQQDVTINQELQRGVQSMGYNQGRLSLRWEKSLHHFQDLLMKHILGER